MSEMQTNQVNYDKCVRCNAIIRGDYYKIGNDFYCYECGEDLYLNEVNEQFKAPLGAQILLVVVYTIMAIITLAAIAMIAATIVSPFTGVDVTGLSVLMSILLFVGVIIIAIVIGSIQIMYINSFINTAKTSFYAKQIYKRINKVYRIEHLKKRI